MPRMVVPARAAGYLGLLALTALAACAPTSQPALPVSDLAGPLATDRLLVVAPHPDDETLCCAGVMLRALATGARVEVVWLTSGDAFDVDAELVEHTMRPTPRSMRALGVMRIEEARRVAGILGLPASSLTFLGYPDRGLLPLLHDYHDKPYASPHTNASAVWYEGALSPGAEYEGRNLERDLTQVIHAFRPTHVLVPSPLDEHPDHRAAADLVMRLLAGDGKPGIIREWVVHGGKGWPAPRGLHRDLPLTPPPRWLDSTWETVPLLSGERDLKLQAVRAYRTQMQIMPRYMLAFVRGNELLIQGRPAAQ
jgi:LmbE family N-acetylglucosaminyl deacetylase